MNTNDGWQGCPKCHAASCVCDPDTDREVWYEKKLEEAFDRHNAAHRQWFERECKLEALLKEAADSIQASQAEEGITEFRREYRVDLEKRIRESLTGLWDTWGKK